MPLERVIGEYWRSFHVGEVRVQVPVRRWQRIRDQQVGGRISTLVDGPSSQFWSFMGVALAYELFAASRPCFGAFQFEYCRQVDNDRSIDR